MSFLGRLWRSDDARDLGNAAFKDEGYADAVKHYTAGLERCSGTSQKFERAKLLSNRSAALVALDLFDDALADASEAVLLAPEWPKAWARQAKAHACLKDFKKASKAYARGLEVSLALNGDLGRKQESDVKTLQAQAQAQADEYLRLLNENTALKGQLEDMHLMFGGGALDKAKRG
ncbi:hypothetical protein M885DRAFT_234479 [Pelagophyceae sp. CCMP2097]|nr:hypothetical protein M885DRAFT_234479 [Pelagophyceae sp. CCMP2097]|mmetsp:Transcript_22538/g.76198  ORF Transcript_22538/g.76198 Transcript_22538/m.76198 type:complete len:176 (-) Transcript_22538:1026-1553(-)